MTPYDRRRNSYVNRMAQDMQIRKLAPRTIDSYTWHVDKFCSHFGKMPEELGLEEIRQPTMLQKAESESGRGKIYRPLKRASESFTRGNASVTERPFVLPSRQTAFRGGRNPAGLSFFICSIDSTFQSRGQVVR